MSNINICNVNKTKYGCQGVIQGIIKLLHKHKTRLYSRNLLLNQLFECNLGIHRILQYWKDT